MSDSFVSDIAPMPQAVVEGMRREEGRGGGGAEGEEAELTQSIAKLITVRAYESLHLWCPVCKFFSLCDCTGIEEI